LSRRKKTRHLDPEQRSGQPHTQRETLLQALEREGAPATLARLQALLEAPGPGAAEALKQALAQLIRAGEVICNRREEYLLVSKADLVPGRVQGHRDGFGFLNPEQFKAGFAADASDADAAFLRDSQVPIALSAFETRLENAAWRMRPSWAVIATQDKAFDLRMLRTMAERIGATVTEVEASHAVFMTRPQEVADVIDKAAQDATAMATAAAR
jgi:exoribonuclease R